MNSDAQILFDPFQKQRTFMDAWRSGQFLYMLYGGAIKGGKTFLTLAILIMLCKIYPGSRWCVVRKDLPTIRRNVLPVYNVLRPVNFLGEVNGSTWSSRATNGSEILFFPEGADRDPDLLRWSGLDVNGFDLDEMNELKETSFTKAIERAGTWNHVKGKMPAPLILGTCNPSQGWVKRMFYDPWAAGKLQAPYFFLPALPSDNPTVSKATQESWKNMPDAWYKRYVLGDWNVADDPMQIIPYDALHSRLVNTPEEMALLLADYCEEALGIDVADTGDDMSTLVHMRGPIMYEVSKYSHVDPAQLAGIALPRIIERGIAADKIGVDTIGVGAGTWGSLKQAGFVTNRIVAGSSPIARRCADPNIAHLKFANLKSQIWWQLRDDVTNPESPLRVINDVGLIQDIIAMRYRIDRESTVRCESKDELRLRIGRSPDAGDAAVMANWVRQLTHSAAVESGNYETVEATDCDSIWN